jgi:hypothetical protein
VDLYCAEFIMLRKPKNKVHWTKAVKLENTLLNSNLTEPNCEL